ncbi:MAG TPA: AAA family ATPase [Roseiflexaceae bacterium]|nr:AAA family ATPase [Roseiflexaceae bacterium]
MELLERDHALCQLDAALKDSIAGQGRIVLVSGEAGIGKTALIDRFTAVHRASSRVLWGACDALFTPRPLGPLYDIAAQMQGDLLTLLTAQANRADLFGSFLNDLRQHPSIVVFEDVHWADDATLDIIKFLGRRMQAVPSVIILTYRDDEIGLSHPLRLVLGDLARFGATRRIPLSPLSEQAVRQLIGDRVLDPAALHRQTGGNPFFVTETIASGASGIPSSVRDAVLARAARLSAAGRTVLEAAAVIGLRIEPPLLAEVVGAESLAVDECMDIGMLVGQGEVLAFRHELARQTILEAISPQQRLILHRLVLERLRGSPASGNHLARLVHHAQAANDPEAVCRYAPAAARCAAAVSAHREAAAHYALALRFAHDLPSNEYALLLEAYAQECNITDQRLEGIAARRKALELWRTLGNTLKQGENLALLAVMHSGIGQTAEAEQVNWAAIELLEALPPSRELALAYRTQATLRMFSQDTAEAIAWGEKAIALAERFQDYETLAMADNVIGYAQIVFDYEQGRQCLERSLAVARQAGLELRIANAYANLGSASGEVYQFLRAERDLSEGIAFTLERDLDAARLYMQAWLALTHLHLGHWSEAADVAASLLDCPGVSAISRIVALVAIGRLRARRGDPGVAEALDEALELAEQTGHLQRLGPVRIARAEAAWLAGDRVRLAVESQAVYDLAVAKRHPWFAGELSFWRWRAGDRASLSAWMAHPFVRQIEGDWRAAASEWEQLGCPYEQAIALMDGDHAAQLLALEIYNQLGALPAAEMVQQKLRAIPERRREREIFGGLTARERVVATLIAQGKSNREIAAAMTVHVKTIETYVTRILNKLDFDSRVQIATWTVEKQLPQSSHRSEC